jgi:hypothetical protein
MIEEISATFFSIFQNFNIVYIGIILAGIGLTAQIYFNVIRPRGKKRIVFYIYEEILSLSHFGGDAKKIVYKGKLRESVRISYIFFWNNGWDTINNSDIPKKGTLTIIPFNDRTSFYGADLVTVNNPANDVKIQYIDGSAEVEIQFDYLDNKNGGVVQIINNGGEEKSFNIVGEIKGVRKPISPTIFPPIRVFPHNWNLPLRSILIIILFIAACVELTYRLLTMQPPLDQVALTVMVLLNTVPQGIAFINQFGTPIIFKDVYRGKVKELTIENY